MEVVEAAKIMLMLLCDFGWDDITNENQSNNARMECVQEFSSMQLKPGYKQKIVC